MTAKANKHPPILGKLLLALWLIAGVAAGLYAAFREPDNAPFVVLGEEGSLSELWYYFLPIFPWFVFGAFVVWICSRFPYRLVASHIVIPILLVGSALFTWGSAALHQHLIARGPAVTILSGNANIANELQDTLQEVFAGEIAPTEKNTLPIDLNEIIQDMQNSQAENKVYTQTITNIQIDTSILMLPPERAPSNKKASTGLAWRVPFDLVLFHFAGFLLLGGLTHASVYLRQVQERKQRASTLTNQLAEARLSQLQSQIQPHFLFNALNGISAHIPEDPSQAVQMTTKLADLLRESLHTSRDGQAIPLERELKLLDDYLDLQAMRFADRLQVHREIDPTCLEVSVPPFLLQPLAENTIHHALEPHAAPVELVIEARPAGPDHIELRVIDDGPGPQSDAPTRGTGTGIENLRQRLATQFGDDASLTLAARPQPASGTIVTIRLPRLHASHPHRG